MSTGAAPADLSPLRPSRGGPLSALLRFVPGLRGRLLLAFIAISLFVVAAAAAGLYALREVEQAMDRITLKTVPVALVSASDRSFPVRFVNRPSSRLIRFIDKSSRRANPPCAKTFP